MHASLCFLFYFAAHRTHLERDIHDAHIYELKFFFCNKLAAAAANDRQHKHFDGQNWARSIIKKKQQRSLRDLASLPTQNKGTSWSKIVNDAEALLFSSFYAY